MLGPLWWQFGSGVSIAGGGPPAFVGSAHTQWVTPFQADGTAEWALATPSWGQPFTITHP